MRHAHSANDRLSRWRRLAAALLLLAGVWLVVLPLVGGNPAIRRYIERNERLGIDPSVKFYSELPAMPSILADIRAMRQRDAIRREAAYNRVSPPRRRRLGRGRSEG